MRSSPIREDDVGLPVVGIRHRLRVVADTKIASRSIPIGVLRAVRFLLRVAQLRSPTKGGDQNRVVTS
jgi:hypothetical protein